MMQASGNEEGLHHMVAFTTTPSGGNPAGIWIGAEHPSADEMRSTAEDLGYSETAFLTPSLGAGHWNIRYFSPLIEIDFCGHATIAAAVVIGGDEGTLTFHTNVGEVPIELAMRDGWRVATLTSPEPSRRTIERSRLDAALETFGWTPGDLDPHLPVDTVFAGQWHLILPLRDRATLGALRYDFDELANLMTQEKLTTIQVVWAESISRFHSRNPFPVGGVVEDPATGAAAAALGGYLRLHDLVPPGRTIVVIQGADMGRPSRLDVAIPASGGIRVSGTAVPIETHEPGDIR